jgi:hypothetical protein
VLAELLHPSEEEGGSLRHLARLTLCFLRILSTALSFLMSSFLDDYQVLLTSRKWILVLNLVISSSDLLS